ncbi:MAG TPA: ATP-binding protein [Gemmatimonadales bacterium]|nr:ATP-binding protein [Gemmatimonadales bacterium]
MTPPQLPLPPVPPRLRRSLGLRATLLSVVLAAAVYAGALPVYLVVRVRAPALALGVGTSAGVMLEDELARRNDALHRAVTVVRDLVRVGGRPRAAVLETLQRLLALGGARSDTRPQADVPPPLHAALARWDHAMRLAADTLAAAVAALERGTPANAVAALRRAEPLAQSVDQETFEAARLTREYLLERQRVLQAATSEVLRDTLLWLALGALSIPLGVSILRRRIWAPLRELESGLAQVAEGDLNTELPVRRTDETGRLAQHFNEMTRVLRGRAEEQGRFAAAGELLAGVAHEVNNPLMAIASHAENRLADPVIPEDQRGEMAQILRQARRATKLLRGLLRFVRATEREVTRVNLNDVVRGALDLVSYRFGVDEITVGGRLDPDLPAVEGDAIKLEQVVVNLLANAIDALRAITPPRRLSVDTAVGDGRVWVAVTDNGRGVGPEIAPRLFRPFASTKGRRGTGLGLYISRQIAREAGGELSLVPQADAGARFVLALPALPPVAEPLDSPTGPAGGRTSGPVRAVASLAGLRVLIVDDEDAIRRPMARFLERRGAAVDEAGDGEQALARLAVQEPDVILADLRMPRMGGVELYARLEQGRPALAARVLFLSGDISQLAEPGNTPVARERVLVKPVELAELERRILEFARAGGPEPGVPGRAG